MPQLSQKGAPWGTSAVQLAQVLLIVRPIFTCSQSAWRLLLSPSRLLTRKLAARPPRRACDNPSGPLGVPPPRPMVPKRRDERG